MWGESGRRISLPSELRATISASRTSRNGSLHPVGPPTGPKPLQLLTLSGKQGQRVRLPSKIPLSAQVFEWDHDTLTIGRMLLQLSILHLQHRFACVAARGRS